MMIQPQQDASQQQQQQQQQKLYHNRAVSLNYPLSANGMDRPWRHAATPPMLPAMAYGCMFNDGWSSPQEYLSSSSSGSSSSSSSSSSSNNGSASATATMTPSPVDMVLVHPVKTEVDTTVTPTTTMMSSVEIPDSLRITGILAAPTAISPKTDDALITYLNRGQLYAIDLKDTRPETDGNTMITTTISITFHEKSHRQVASNYWKFWLSQQRSTDARAISIDDTHCAGAVNLRFASFDRITFDWDTRQGSRIHVRFHCLSTDFSRIKGVKGIPLRIHMEHRIAPLSASTSSASSSASPPGADALSSCKYVEESFCKIKLFRDKGAERKNKDNSKQYMRHCQKMQENAKGEHQKNLMELMYDLQKPFSVFSTIPQSPPLKHLEHLSGCTSAEFDGLSHSYFASSTDVGFGGNTTGHIINTNNGSTSSSTGNNNKRNRVMTAPSALFHGQQQQHHPSSAFCSPFPAAFATPSPWSPFQSPAVTTTVATPGPGSSYFYIESPTSMYNSSVTTPFDGYATHEHKDMMMPPPPPPPLPPSSRLYGTLTSSTTMPPPPPPPLLLSSSVPASDAAAAAAAAAASTTPLAHNPKKRTREATSDAASGELMNKRMSIRTGEDLEPRWIELQEFTAQELKAKLCTVLSLHPDQVSHIVWRPKDKCALSTTTTTTASPRKKSSSQEIFITMDDDFITQDVLNWQQPTASWEIKADGTVRIVLEN
ncbi:CP2 transcription factor-domain-containing protein [Zychaea mexicana]|uniref:CP2 transcription factor-domain-containing protein n=1 Tax=Zychaea mexicana TaxID=64656 RepID=UPI0022FDDE47|nr:CP2 transcription factor-domain-containing protein [Zychaea mexicana]KAI9490197.1 CP2 transcription factor-domain-containing protein [Zychaea mexicana]